MDLLVSQLRQRTLRSVMLLWLQQKEQAQNFSSNRKTSGKAKHLQSDIEIRPLTRCDEKNALKFLHLYYFSEEPLYIGLEPAGADVIEEKFIMNIVSHEMSFKAELKTASGKPRMVGAIVAGPKYWTEAQRRYNDYCKFGQTKLGLIQKLMSDVEQRGNVFERFNVKEVVHVEAVATDTSVRGLAIGARLMQRVFEYVKELNYKVVTADCTSKYAAEFCDRLGMEVVAMAYYKDFVDGRGNPIFTPPPPHDAVKAYAIRL